jgi:hypothetical protein
MHHMPLAADLMAFAWKMLKSGVLILLCSFPANELKLAIVDPIDFLLLP